MSESFWKVAFAVIVILVVVAVVGSKGCHEYPKGSLDRQECDSEYAPGPGR